MNTYLIRAYESLYGGLYGMETIECVEAINDDEVQEYAKQLSFEVMESYDCIMEYLEDSCEEEDLSDLENLMKENASYEVWRIDPKGISIDELNEKAYNDIESVIEEYAVEEI